MNARTYSLLLIALRDAERSGVSRTEHTGKAGGSVGIIRTQRAAFRRTCHGLRRHRFARPIGRSGRAPLRQCAAPLPGEP